MMYWDDGWGGGGWLVMTLVMVAFWGLVAWAIISAVRGSSSTSGHQRSAEDILAERFARGEISKDEYNERLDALRSSR